jgi:hypothetical protein
VTGRRPAGEPDLVQLGAIDHLVWAGLELQAEIERLERLTGVRAAPGGRHPGEGTRNALVAMGSEMYLELIAPDPTQPRPPSPRWFGLDALTAPRLVTWAAKCRDLTEQRAGAQAAGIRLGEIRSGARETSDGQKLSWQLTYPDVRLGAGLIPFLIDWGASSHPARTAPPGLQLVDLRAEHPAPSRIARQLRRLGLPLRIEVGPSPALIATFESPRGRVELR